MTQVKSALKTIRIALEAGRPPKVRTNTDICQALLAVAQTDSLEAVGLALQAITGLNDAVVYRRELLREMEKAIRAVILREAPSLEEAAWIVRNRSRQLGRVLPRCAVGTTLLVKGLEFQHAVILDADALDAKNLYVALTRGAKSLTIVSRALIIQPKVASGSPAATSEP
jgi:DNA helicase-2/ATP-dependent DNA helicase PcrA